MNQPKHIGNSPRGFLTLLMVACLSIGALSQHRFSFSSITYDRFTHFQNYTIKQGVSSYSFTDIIQDQTGYMWFATREGLLRFDGQTFYTYIGGDAQNQLPSSYIYKLAVDSVGVLWIATRSGLCRYKPQTNDFERVKEFFGIQLKNSDQWVMNLLFDSRGNLWIDGYGGVLTRVNFKAKSVETYQREFVENSIYPYYAIMETKQGVLLGGASSQLQHFNLATQNFGTIGSTRVDGKNLSSASLSDFFDDGLGYIWVASFGDYAYRISKKDSLFLALPFRSAYKFMPVENRMLWAVGYSGGAQLYSMETGQVTAFLNQENNPHSIASNKIYTMYRDMQGNIWFGTDRGLSVLSPHRNRFTHIRKIPETKGLSSNRIRSVLADYPTTLWFGTENRGLVRYNIKENTFKNFGYHSSPDSVGSNTIMSIAKQGSNTLYLALWNGRDAALNSFSIPTERFKRHITKDNYYWYGKVLAHSNGSVWVGAWGAGVYQFNPKLGDFHNSYFTSISSTKPYNTSSQTGIECSADGWVRFLDRIFINVNTNDTVIWLEDMVYHKLNLGVQSRNIISTPYNLGVGITANLLHNGKQYVIKTDGKLYSINLAQRKYSVLATDPELQRIFADEYVYVSTNAGKVYRLIEGANRELLIANSELGVVNSVAEVGVGGLLVGSSTGIFLLRKDSTQWTLQKHLFKQNVNQLTKVRDRYFFATHNGVVEVNAKGEVVGELFEGDNITSITSDSTKHVWVVSAKGLFKINSANSFVDTLKTNPLSEHGLPSTKISSMATDAKGRVWLATDRCIVSYCNQSMQFTSYYEPSYNAITHNLVIALNEDREGGIWVGSSTPHGVNRIDVATGKVRHYVNKSYDPESFPRAVAYGMIETQDGQIAISTDAGLALMQGRANKFKIVNKDSGLAHNKVTAVAEDSVGTLWLGTPNGLSSYKPSTGEVINYSSSEGIHEEIVNQIVPFGPNQMVAVGFGGAILFNPANVSRDTTCPPLIISYYTIDGTQTFHNPEQNSLVKLKASSKSIDITFAALDYSAPERIHYQHQLVGYDDTLLLASHAERVVRYANLPYGSYTFRVKCCNSDGIWCSDWTTLQIRVMAPFYLRWWFILITILLIGSFLYLFILSREAWLRRENQRLEELVRDKTRKVTLQNEELKSQHELITDQANLIKRVNLHLTDSIEYAESLQSALMPSVSELESVLGSHFLLFKPKDIVSGDFFWVKGSFERFTLVVADCTGHGVHGGFMSMLGLTFVNEAFGNPLNRSPKNIVEDVHRHFTSSLHLEKNASSFTSGMDIAVCEVDRTKGTVRFAGTGLTLYVVNSRGDIQKFKSGTKAVGSTWFNPDIPLHSIDVEPGYRVYIPTDGAFDQLSVVERKRFSRKQFEVLIDEVNERPMEQQRGHIQEAIAQWQGNAVQTDDITILGFVV